MTFAFGLPARRRVPCGIKDTVPAQSFTVTVQPERRALSR
jgi:hypothetical protein